MPLGRAFLSAWIEHRSGQSFRPNQGLKARPHALNRFALARKRFIAFYWLAAPPMLPRLRF
jgi:hypothetical protein